MSSIRSHQPHLILASSSVYRRQLLERLRIPFDVIAPDIDETSHAGETPQETAMRLAYTKAATIGAQYPDSIVIGSDQVATLDNEQIGKPGTHENALRQLQKMRGRSVIFHTALCVWNSAESRPDHKTQIENIQTIVTFRDLSDEEFDAYLRIEQPYDCAGSARNEALGITILEKIESSDPTALTGLPMIALTTMLRRCGVSLFQINAS